MKKFLRSILCLVLALCMVMCFAACSDNDRDDDDEEEEDSIVGTYQFYEMTQDGETISRADLEEELEAYAEYMEEEIDMDEFCYLKLKKDGTGMLCMMGEEMDMEYDDDYIWPVGEEDDKVEYTFRKGKITMEQDDSELIFKK